MMMYGLNIPLTHWLQAQVRELGILIMEAGMEAKGEGTTRIETPPIIMGGTILVFMNSSEEVQVRGS